MSQSTPSLAPHPLRQLAEAHNLSLLKLAAASGAPYSSVCSMAGGQRPVSAPVFAALRRAGFDVQAVRREIQEWEAARRADAQAELAQAAATR